MLVDVGSCNVPIDKLFSKVDDAPLTINGEKHIKDLKINDIVFSFNEKSLEIEKDIVLKIFDTNVQDIMKIETEEGVLEVTPNSEIYTNKGIVLAKDLQENDEIIVFF